jgi:hypothetical protein
MLTRQLQDDKNRGKENANGDHDLQETEATLVAT